MADLAKEESAKEVENIIGNSKIMFRSYSNLGLRDDTDFYFGLQHLQLKKFKQLLKNYTKQYLENTSSHQEHICRVRDRHYT